ncbi:MAG TPA: radical SAM protein, partial [Desulfatiglandales bacterium]|nr:radical SAM protein [Desulfatiglandales bacterium]
MALTVNEIFYSIQGESTYAGRPCVFIRLTGCNLRCSYCDTQYAYHDGEKLNIREIINKVALYGCPLVEVTGGEPLLQEETPYLTSQLLGTGYKVLIETNGSQDISRVDSRCVRIVDIKCPSSGEKDKNDLANLNRLRDEDELKFVIGGWEDYEYAKDILNLIGHGSSSKIAVHLSPSFGRMKPEELAGWILNDRLNVRLHLQLHKYIWPPGQRG